MNYLLRPERLRKRRKWYSNKIFKKGRSEGAKVQDSSFVEGLRINELVLIIIREDCFFIFWFKTNFFYDGPLKMAGIFCSILMAG